MVNLPLPDNEAARLRILKSYTAICPTSDPVLAGIVKAASDLCEVPIASINFVHSTDVRSISCVGMDRTETPRDAAFCAYTILDPKQLLQIKDARADKRFSTNQLVENEPLVRFYTGVPLVTDDHYTLGTLCVLDSHPRQLSTAQLDALSSLADTVMKLLCERRLAQSNSIPDSESEEVVQPRISRNRLAKIVEFANNEIYIADAQTFQLLNVNRAARENLGYSAEELQQIRTWEFILGITQQDFKHMTQSLVSGAEDVYKFEAQHQRKDGSTYSTITHLQRISEQAPHVVAAFVTDTSDTRRQDEMLKLRDRAIESLDVGVSITDASKDDHPLVYVNQTLCTLSGYSANEVLGKGVKVLQKNDQHQPEHTIIQEAQAKGEPVRVRFKSTRKDGSHYIDELSLSPVHDDAGDLTHYIGINRDVTTMVETEYRLRQSQKLEAIGQLSGGIAHDFNNLLDVIMGNLEFLSEQLNNEKQREFLEEADSAAKMGSRLTRRLLSFAKQSQLDPEVLDVNEYVLGAIALLKSTIGKSVSLSSSLSPDLWRIRADPSEIENTIVNLVINARDAMPNGGKVDIVTKNITFTSDDIQDEYGVSEGDYVRITVSDNGAGMPEEVRTRIFEPFFTTKEHGKGTGLGLSTIHGFVKQSDGHLNVYSEEGHGTVINVYLPKYASANEEALSSTSPAKPTNLAKGGRILIVDDNELVRKLTTNRVKSLGYSADQVCNGGQAVDYLREHPETILVLSDIIMEGSMSGYEVANWVQKNSPHIKILLTSGFSTDIAKTHEIEPNKLSILQKPYSLAELQQALNLILECDSTNT